MNFISKILNTILLLLVTISVYSQQTVKQSIGINIAQLSALSLDVDYEYEIKPYLNFYSAIGYSYNHTKSWDINFFLVPHIKCGNCGIKPINQTGGFLKTGVKINARRNFTKHNFFFLGINLINSVVYEKADFSDYYDIPPPDIILNPIQEQTKYVFGIGTQYGYSFKVFKKIQADVGLQIAFPLVNYKYLYGYENYIPGIGYKGSYSNWFPVIIFNLKYMIKKEK